MDLRTPIIGTTLEELQARKKQLSMIRENMKTGSKISSSISFLMTLAILTAAIMGATGHSGALNNPAYLFLIFFLIPYLFYYKKRSDDSLKEVERDIKEIDFEIELQRFEVSSGERRAEKILQINEI